jgi:predicted nucleic acid-binding protein
MKRYLLDNGVLVANLKGRSGAVRLLEPWIDAQEVVTSIIVYGEAIEYFKALPGYSKNRNGLRTLLQVVTAFKLTYPIMERYTDLRRAMRPPRGSGLIGDADTLIAATALHHGLTVVTLDGDYTRVPSLSTLLLTRRDLN